MTNRSAWPLISVGAHQWIEKTALWLGRSTGADYWDLRDAGRFATLKALKDREIVGSEISDGAKRYIRREMLREAAPSWYPKYQQMIDYGYEDGRQFRRGRRNPLTNKGIRQYHRRIGKGLCPRCGRPPESEKLQCDKCLLYKRLHYKKRQEEKVAINIGKPIFSERERKIIIEAELGSNFSNG